MLQPKTPKEQLAIGLRLWINHKRVLAKHSKYYQQAEQAKSISAVYDLYLLVKRNCNEINLELLCKMVIQNEKHLRIIMPAQANTSYKTQLEKLENLLITAKLHKQ